MKISADPDQMASSKAIWSGSTLFLKAMPILIQQDKGLFIQPAEKLYKIALELRLLNSFALRRAKTPLSFGHWLRESQYIAAKKQQSVSAHDSFLNCHHY